MSPARHDVVARFFAIGNFYYYAGAVDDTKKWQTSSLPPGRNAVSFAPFAGFARESEGRGTAAGNRKEKNRAAARFMFTRGRPGLNVSSCNRNQTGRHIRPDLLPAVRDEFYSEIINPPRRITGDFSRRIVLAT